MKSKRLILVAFLAFVIGGGATAAILSGYGSSDPIPPDGDGGKHILTNLVEDQPDLPDAPDDDAPFVSSLKNNEEPIPPFMIKSLDWLAKAQQPNGGYGAGTHSRQDIHDPHAVNTDPATSALVGMALVRTGNTLKSGPYAAQVAGIHNYLLNHIEGAVKEAHQKEGEKKENKDEVVNGDVLATPDEGYGRRGSRISINNYDYNSQTQPQRKLGQNIDATFASQFLTRILEFTSEGSELHARTENAIEVCIKSIQEKQSNDGSMEGGTWAGVLQSSMANSALEQADGKGMKIDKDKLRKSRGYQRGNVDVSNGSVVGTASAGVSLYTYSSTNRATAANTRNARETVERAKNDGTLDLDDEVNEDNLIKAGVSKEEAEEWVADYRANEVSAQQLKRDDVLSGFGNNGGEEFISYMMTSEGLVISGGDAWDDWNKKMNTRLSKIQNNDGSWSGHHCITSPVFCTAAVIMTLATDRDVEYIATTVK